MALLKSPIPYQGSKRRELHIIEQFQPKKFDKLVDVFGGGGSVSLYYLQAYKPFKRGVWFNDISPDLFELFTTLKSAEKTAKLLESYKNIPVTKEEHTKRVGLMKEAYKNNTSDLESFLFLTKTTMRGFIGSALFNTGRAISGLDKIPLYPDVVKDLNVTQLDAKEILLQHKHDKNAFLYLDPPYLDKGTSNQSYRKCSVDLVKFIVDFVNDPDTECKVMLHCDFSGYIYDKFKNKLKHHYPSNFSSANASKKEYHPRYQAIITNY